MFNASAKNGKIDSPKPSLIRFLSRKFSEFFAKEETVKLFNIPEEVLENAQINPQTATYEEVLHSPIGQKWIYSEATDYAIRLNEAKKTLLGKLQGWEEIYGRIIFKGLIFGLEHSLSKILKECKRT